MNTTQGWTHDLRRALAFAAMLALPGLGALQAQDREPLVNGGDGAATDFNDVISSTTPDELLQVTVVLPAAVPHSCHVFASSAAEFGGNGTYVFGVRDGGSSVDFPVAESARAIEFTDNPDNDEARKPIGTNFTFTNLTGTHTFRYSARKFTGDAANMTVDKSTMSVICLKRTL